MLSGRVAQPVPQGLVGRIVVLETVYRSVLIVLFPCLVQCLIAADGETEGFDGFYLFPVVTSVPNLYHCFLYHIFGLRAVERYAQRQSVELVFHWQDICLETDIFHPFLY